jgi:signal transduction histidine kinase
MRTARSPRNTLILGKTYREHIGGRWAISLLAYLINAPLNVLAILGNVDSAPTSSDALTWVLIAVIGYFVLGVVLVIANFTLFSNRRSFPVPVWWVVALGSTAGAARGLTVGVLADATDLAAGGIGTTLIRIATGMVLGGILVPFVALMLSSISSYISSRQELIAEQQLLYAERMRAEGVSEAVRIALIESLQEDLDEVARTQSAELARGVSHRVWENAEETRPPTLKWGQVFLAAFIRNPYPIAPVAVIWLLSSWGGLIPTIGVIPAILQMAFTVLCITLVFLLGRRLTSSRAGVSLFVFVMMMLILVTLTGPVASLMFDPRELAARAPLILINSVWLPTLTIAAGIVVSAVRSSEAVLATLTHQVDEEEIATAAAEQENQRIRRELATKLHGNVQSRLLAAAGLMRQPALLQRAELSDPALLIQELSGDLLIDDESASRTLNEQLDVIIRPWSGLMKISVNISDRVDQAFAPSIIKVVEEGLANAFRHGSAREVRCEVHTDGAEVLVVIHNDGQGDGGPRTPGIGSAVLNSLSSDWSMRALPEGGYQLSVRLAPRAAHSRGDFPSPPPTR